MTDMSLPGRRPLAASSSRARSPLWAIVLAGGHGMRLRPLVRQVYGEDRPKQYAALLGPRSLLRQTLDRVALVVPPARTVVVTLASHAPYTAAEFGERGGPRTILVQPEDRGTAAGILYSAHWIRARDPAARVVVFPSDHFVLKEDLFARHVLEVAGFVQQHPEWLILLGAQPTEAETGYGWIEVGERVGWTAHGPVRRVRRFQEKPSAETARLLFLAGCLWNTFVFAASAAALVEAGRRCLPDLDERLASITSSQAPVTGGRRSAGDAAAVREAFEGAAAADFSRAVLERSPAVLGVSTMPPVDWCDLGTVGRLRATLARLGMRPSWAEALSALSPTGTAGPGARS